MPCVVASLFLLNRYILIVLRSTYYKNAAPYPTLLENHNGHLVTTATFSPQGGRCAEVQLYCFWPSDLSSSIHCLMLHVVGGCLSGSFQLFSLLYLYLQLIFQMPQSHRNVFTYISAFLRELLLHSNDNKLDAKTLGKSML